MKKRLLLAGLAAILLAGCGTVPAEDAENAKNNAAPSAVTQTEEEQPQEDSSSETESVDNTSSETVSETESESSSENDKAFVSIDLTTSEKEGVTGVGIFGYYDNGSLHDLYARHVLHSGVVGLYSPPVEFDCENFKSAVIQFNIDKDNMGNVPLGNLIMLHYNEETSFYDTVQSDTDSTSFRVTARIEEPGVYLLADAYQWYKCWGVDVSQYEPTVNTDSSPFDYEQHGRYDCTEYGFTMQLPDYATQFGHTESYACDQYKHSTFSRITSDIYFALFIDVSVVEPKEPMTLEELAEIYPETRGKIYGDYPHSTIRTIESYEEIQSVDGKKGLRFIGSDQYYVGDELEEPYETWYDVYPYGDGFIEFRAEYLQKDGSSQQGLEHKIAADILSTVNFDR